MLVFQHTSTARWRAEDGTLEVVLYGRTAQGVSVALRVSGCSAYGFISGAAVDAAFRRHVATLVQWHMSLQRSEQSCRRYKDEHGEDKPTHKVYRAWSGFFFPPVGGGGRVLVPLQRL